MFIAQTYCSLFVPNIDIEPTQGQSKDNPLKADNGLCFARNSPVSVASADQSHRDFAGRTARRKWLKNPFRLLRPGNSVS
jgi:hypothetical protein